MRSVIGFSGWMLAMLPVASMAAQAPPPDPFADPYREFCAVCHGANLEGAAQGVPLAGRALAHGDGVDTLAVSIADGFPQGRMPAFSATMDPAQIRRLATFIAEKRAGLSYTDFRVAAPPAVPEGVAAAGSARARLLS